jgi:hypothetical protein
MKKIAMIASAITLLTPEIANCRRVTDPELITVDGINYQKNRNGSFNAISKRTDSAWLPRNFIGINGEVCEVSCIENPNKDSSDLTYILAPNLQLVCIPSSVKIIGQECFYACYTLKIVAFESGSQLTMMGDSAFNACSVLQSVCIPFSVGTLGEECFQNCPVLGSIVFEPNSRLEMIEASAFGCGFLTFMCPASVRTIRRECFNKCNSLISITFEPGSQLETIEEGAFSAGTIVNSCPLPIPGRQ